MYRFCERLPAVFRRTASTIVDNPPPGQRAEDEGLPVTLRDLEPDRFFMVQDYRTDRFIGIDHPPLVNKGTFLVIASDISDAQRWLYDTAETFHDRPTDFGLLSVTLPEALKQAREHPLPMRDA